MNRGKNPLMVESYRLSKGQASGWGNSLQNIVRTLSFQPGSFSDQAIAHVLKAMR